jgi:hypothetical protein
MILYEELQREMGLNHAKEEGFTFFGIRAKKEELVLPLILQDSWAY